LEETGTVSTVGLADSDDESVRTYITTQQLEVEDILEEYQLSY